MPEEWPSCVSDAKGPNRQPSRHRPQALRSENEGRVNEVRWATAELNLSAKMPRKRAEIIENNSCRQCLWKLFELQKPRKLRCVIPKILERINVIAVGLSGCPLGLY